MIKAAIFDMDGLIIDSEPFWRQAHIGVLGRYGFTITEDDVRAAAGKRTHDQVKLWQERFNWTEPASDIVTAQIDDHVVELVRLNGVALPGVFELIELLKQHAIPMAVASSSSSKLIAAVLERLELTKTFTLAHSAEHERRGKPFPDVFLTTAQELGVAPAACLVLEDSVNGVKAAKAAGMKCVAVPEQPHDPKRFTAADLVVDSLEELTWPVLTKLWD